MFRWALFPILALAAAGPAAARLETRVHRFTNSPPRLVEKQIRHLVPEEPRVSMKPEAGQVIVIAEPSVQGKISSMIAEMDRPPPRLRFRLRHNREAAEFTVGDGVPFTLPVSSSPPEDVTEPARAHLPLGRRDLPVVGTALRVHVKLLRESPPAARLRITPAFAFGTQPPYEVVTYDHLSMDLMATPTQYLELSEALYTHEFYRRFLRTRPDAGRPSRPVGLLLSFDKLDYGGDGEPMGEPTE